jgi:hypothetical protein
MPRDVLVDFPADLTNVRFDPVQLVFNAGPAVGLERFLHRHLCADQPQHRSQYRRRDPDDRDQVSGVIDGHGLITSNGTVKVYSKEAYGWAA